jgi:choline dehydrogenase-like flavoprotein
MSITRTTDASRSSRSSRRTYQVGYGPAAFSGGALQEAVSLTTLYRLTAVLAVLMGLMSIPIAGTLRRPAAVHRVETMSEPGGAGTGITRSDDDLPRRPPYRRTRTEPADHSEELAMPEHYDVIVIGTGAGGGTLAHTLAPSGKRILLLEWGYFLPRETQNRDPESVFVDGYHPFSAPSGILLDEADRRRSTSIRCTCATAIRASCTPSPTPKLETDPTGRSVTGVVARDGVQETYEADIVVVSAGASNSAKILLRSANDHHPTSNNDDEADRLYHELKKILNHIGMAEHHVLGKIFYMKMNIPIAGCAHQAGTCRFGTDPATSVLDPSCKAHEVDNLYVVDTSSFPSIGAVNPALTAMANGIRVGEHLLERLR